MYRLKEMILMLCLILSGALCHAHGEARIDNGPIGFTPVYYWDNPYATNEYTINGFKWSFKSYIIPVKN